MAFMPDHEPSLGSSDFPNSTEWCSGYNISEAADLLFHDGQYSNKEYDRRVGWGHSSVSDAIDFGNLSKVKKMVLFHHDPAHTDMQLEEMVDKTIQGKINKFLDLFPNQIIGWKSLSQTNHRINLNNEGA